MYVVNGKADKGNIRTKVENGIDKKYKIAVKDRAMSRFYDINNYVKMKIIKIV